MVLFAADTLFGETGVYPPYQQEYTIYAGVLTEWILIGTLQSIARMSAIQFFSQNLMRYKDTPTVTDVLSTTYYRRSFRLCRLIEPRRKIGLVFMNIENSTFVLSTRVITSNGSGIYISESGMSDMQSENYRYTYSMMMQFMQCNSYMNWTPRYLLVGTSNLSVNKGMLNWMTAYLSNSPGDNDVLNIMNQGPTPSTRHNWTIIKSDNRSYPIISLSMREVPYCAIYINKINDSSGTPSFGTEYVDDPYDNGRWYADIAVLSSRNLVVMADILQYSSSGFSVRVFDVSGAITQTCSSLIESGLSGSVFAVNIVRITDYYVFVLRSNSNGAGYYVKLFNIAFYILFYIYFHSICRIFFFYFF